MSLRDDLVEMKLSLETVGASLLNEFLLPIELFIRLELDLELLFFIARCLSSSS